MGDPARVGLFRILEHVSRCPVGWGEYHMRLGGGRLRADVFYGRQTLVDVISYYASARAVTLVDAPLGAEPLIRKDRLIGHHTGQRIPEKPATNERVEDRFGHPKFVYRLLTIKPIHVTRASSIRSGKSRWCTAGVLLVGLTPSLLFAHCVFPAKHCFLLVGDAGFEPATSSL